MNDLIPTPNRIADMLGALSDNIRDDNLDKRTALRTLAAAVANVKLLFELKADPETGEFKLENYGQAWMLADLLRGGEMVPSSYKTDEQVVIGLMKAMEIGVSPISGLGNIMIINNRPSVWGDLAQALVQRTGAIANYEREEVGTKPEPMAALDKWPLDYGWRVSFWRKGQDKPYVATYTVADAKRAGLWANTRKQPWITDPATMLFNRARARAIRDGFADKLFGMGIIEEQQDFAPIDGGALSHEPARLTSSLTDDEPETEAAAPVMANYAERSEPETASEAAGEPPAAEGSEPSPEPGIASSESEGQADGANESAPLL